ncbi:major facilitator superfamily domain-containing protein 6 [Parasteatoda tepidariorum]|uniref:major facilitator superfamily domain-containing protein 6 n=1 Tax=Parasteatoda tepidariorum TaxID=114398 RepID=UPI00077FC932|nr:major facilitator superfamily domain-containing protein 6 [Parasteatoda tepidariorum]
MVEMKGLEDNRAVPRPLDTDGYVPPPDSNDPRARSGPGSKKDIIDNVCSSFNQDLLIAKTFYFFFFSAFGSLFPLLAVYFKQMGMNPTQSGFLIGVRPFVEFLAAPFWGSMADRFRKGKIMLLFSLLSWIVFTLALAFIQPPASSCVIYNNTHHVLFIPDKSETGRAKRSVSLDLSDYDPIYEDQELIDQVLAYEASKSRDRYSYLQEPNSTDEDIIDSLDENEIGNWLMGIRKRREKETEAAKEDKKPAKLKPKDKDYPSYVVGQSPNSVEFTLNYNKDQHTSYVSPRFSSIVYKWEDVQEVFFLLVLLIVLGEFFSAPAITLADSATISYLADNADNYGKQRMFGSLGWGLAMFFVGIALDQSTAFPDHPCGPHERERNYTICFATFSVLMGCALIAATQLKFEYEVIEDQVSMKTIIQNGAQPQVKGSGLPSFLTEGTVMDDSPIPIPPPQKPEETAPKSTVFAQTTRQLPEWLSVLRTFANLRYGAFLYVTWFMGFGIGLVFTFLFWHLQDLGGTPTLFGVASVINHISEIFAYFFSFKFIRQIGHTKVLCIGLIGNIGRFLYISWLKNPWWVLPFEFIQGITHAAVWAACCSYITQATPANLRSSAQGVLQGLHHGLGRGCGAVIGGIFVNYFGTQVTFRGYGFASLIVLILFVFINYYRKDKGFASFQDDQEPDTVVEETAHLAPHGVPSNPMARSLSKQNIGGPRAGTNNNEGGYGTASPNRNATTGGYLGVPGGGDNGGGYSVEGQNYTSDFNMNKTPLVNPVESGGALTRRALAAVFNPKGILAQAASPEGCYPYEFIRRDFQAYDEVQTFTQKPNDEDGAKYDVLVGPAPKTKLYSPQPENHNEIAYDW